MRLPPLVKKFLDELEEMGERFVNAARESDHAQKEQPKPSPEVRAVISAPDGIETKKHPADAEQEGRYQIWNLRLQGALCVFTAGAFVAAAIYAGYAKKQWKTMNDTYTEIKTQTGEISNQTKLLRQQVVGTQQAILQLVVNSPGIWPLQGEGFYAFVNTGPVPAKDATFTVSVSHIAVPSGKVLPGGGSYSQTFPLVPRWENVPGLQDWVLANNAQGPLQFVFRAFPVKSKEAELFADTKMAVAVKGKITYNNGFDEMVEVPLCAYMFGYRIQVPNPDRIEIRPLPAKNCTNSVSFEHAMRKALWDIDTQLNRTKPGAQPPSND